jgi:surface antigen
MTQVVASLKRLHDAIVEVQATARLDSATRLKLSEAAKEALRLSHELSQLQTQIALQKQQQNTLKKIKDFISEWVSYLTGLSHGN